MPVQVLGVGELVGRMKALPDKLRKKGLRRAMKQCARPIVNATKALAPVRTGLLRQSIASVVVKSRDGGASALIGMRRSLATKRRKAQFKPSKKITKTAGLLGVELGSPSRYAHLVEFGHNIVHKGGKGGGGRVAAHPFLRPGLASGAPAAEQILANELRSFLEQEAGK